MDQLQQTIHNNEEKKSLMRAYIPKFNPNLEETNDGQLDAIEGSLMGLLSKFKPQNPERALSSQPIPFEKSYA